MNYALIMAGGAGTRLWPLSREHLSKPALKLYSEKSMFQIAVERLYPLFEPEQVMVVAGAEHAQVLSAQVPEIPAENFIIEPFGRNTAPAIGLAAVHLRRRDPAARMAVLTADHFIGDTETFRRAIGAGLELAETGWLVTLGISPTYPSTEYGYIEQAEALDAVSGFQTYRAERFVEKPSLDKAQKMLAVGGYSWNSGMFMWQVDAVLEEMRLQMPALHKPLIEIEAAVGTSEYGQVLAEAWAGVPKQSIDYGIMENARQVAVIPVEMAWKDIGSWLSLNSLVEADRDGNAVQGDVLLKDCKDLLVMGRGTRLVAAVGVHDLVIVDTPDALLVCHKDKTGEVKLLVNELKEKNRGDLV